jgi:hypothetical protein
MAGFLLSSFIVSKAGPGPADVIFGTPLVKQSAVTDLRIVSDLGTAFATPNPNNPITNLDILADVGVNFGAMNQTALTDLVITHN